MPHDFKRFPELTNSQMQLYYWDSPHKQITEDIRVKVIKVHDADTITVRWSERDFDFPVRFLGIDAPELNAGGHAAKDWLTQQILNEEVDLIIDKNQRVGKWGRLLANVISGGLDLGEWMMSQGLVTSFEDRRPGEIPALIWP